MNKKIVITALVIGTGMTMYLLILAMRSGNAGLGDLSYVTVSVLHGYDKTVFFPACIWQDPGWLGDSRMTRVIPVTEITYIEGADNLTDVPPLDG